MDIDDAINLAIDNVKKDGLTDVDVFSLPFEIEMIKDDVRNRIFQATKDSQKNNSISSLRVSPISHILFPKKELFDFRKCAHIQPLDEIKYLSLVLQLADKIEAARLEKGKKYVFSYRFNPLKGSLFDPDFNYTSFRDHVLKKSRDAHVTVMVSCDISNFYDRLNLHRLESILASLPETNHKVVKQINELLLFWSNRDSYGLPVGSNASRILAEASLIEVDNYLVSKKIIFCRFVDDYRLFANDAATAHHWLSLLVDRLSKEGFFINTSKTQIKDVSESVHETDLTTSNLKKSLFLYAKNEEKKSIEQVSSQQKIEEHGDASINEAGVDVAQEKKGLSKIIRGYSGLIPTKFRKLTDNEKRKLRFFNRVLN